MLTMQWIDNMHSLNTPKKIWVFKVVQDMKAFGVSRTRRESSKKKSIHDAVNVLKDSYQNKWFLSIWQIMVAAV